MGTWDETSFGNDKANDWAYGLEECDDLSYIDATLQRILDAGDEYLEGPDGDEAIAAAEVVAWLLGRPTPVNAYTKKVAEWVAAHPIQPTPELTQKAVSALDRILRPPSELLELWEESGSDRWTASVADIRARLTV
jgi:hypothetical protein